MKSRILVTGGTGFIGSHTVVELLQNDFEVVIIDDLSNSDYNVLDRIEKITGIRPLFHQFDLKDKQELEQFFSTQLLHGVIHFAASKAVGESVSDPLKYYRNNLEPLINLLEMMQKYQTRNFVFSSSCTIYGQPDQLPVTETSPIQEAESPYGNTKKIGEDILKDTAAVNPWLSLIALRYFNPVGAHRSGLIGELPNGVPNNLIPYITQTAAGKRKELTVFGNDYNTPDGTAIRDFIHVTDLAKAHVAALNRLLRSEQDSNYEFFNIGTGKGFSVLEVIECFELVNRVKLNYKYSDRRKGDIEKIYADTSLANKKLKWKAQSKLYEMLQSAWNWEVNQATFNKDNDEVKNHVKEHSDALN